MNNFIFLLMSFLQEPYQNNELVLEFSNSFNSLITEYSTEDSEYNFSCNENGEKLFLSVIRNDVHERVITTLLDFYDAIIPEFSSNKIHIPKEFGYNKIKQLLDESVFKYKTVVVHSIDINYNRVNFSNGYNIDSNNGILFYDMYGVQYSLTREDIHEQH